MSAPATYHLPRLTNDEAVRPWATQLVHELNVGLGMLHDEIMALVTGVSSFNGRVGAVTPDVGDYSAFYSLLAHTHDHTTLTNIGINSHAAIDTHIANASIHLTDHGALGGLGDDDHSIYTLKAGRSGTNNNTILSTDGDGTLTGSAVSTGDLKLVAANGSISGGTTVTVGYIEPLQPVRLLTGGYTFDNDTATPSATQFTQLSTISAGLGILTLSGSFPSFCGYACIGTVSLTESAGNPFGMGLLFDHAFTYTNADGLNFGPTQTLVDQPTFSVNTTAGARTHPFHAALYSRPVLSRSAGANAFGMTSHSGVDVSANVGTGTSITTQYVARGSQPGGIAAGIANSIGLALDYGSTTGGTPRITSDYFFAFDAAPGTHGAVSAHAGAGTPTLGAGNAPVTGDPDGWLHVRTDTGALGRIPYWL